jgi:hypothetical protein
VKILELSGHNVYSDVPFYGSKPSVNDEIIVGLLNGDETTPVAITNSALGSSSPSSQGDIEGVTAGLGLSGGGTSGTVSLAFAPSELSSVTVATDDKVVIADTSDSDNPKHVTVSSIAALATASPAGSDHQVQWNNDGSFGADANFTYDGSTVSISADLTVDSGALFVDASANSVGINTASPQVALHVSSTGTEAVRIQRSPTDQVGSYIGMYDDDERLGYIGYAGNDDLYLENEATAGNTYLSTGGSIRLAIDTNGKVGIGTTTPVAGIDITTTAGDTWTTSSWDQGLILNAGSAVRWRTSGSVDWGIGNSGALLYFTSSTAADDSAAADYRMVIEGDTGSVGIGTTSPVGNLTVKSQNREISIIDSGSTNYAEIRAHAAGDATGYANVNYNAYSHTFLTGGTSRMNIANGGTAHIGTSSRKLIFQPESNEILKLVGDTASARPYISFWNRDASGNLDRKGYIGYPHAANNTSSLYIRCDQGTLDLGAKILLPSTANYVLWPATLNTVTSYSTLRRGTYSGTANVVGYDGSSIRYKENVTNFVKSDWEKIYNLQAVRFTWKEEVAADKHASWGLISEDVYAEIPELGVMRVVEGVNDGNPVPDTVNYEQMCVFLLEAVKDLNARLAAVE